MGRVMASEDAFYALALKIDEIKRDVKDQAVSWAIDRAIEYVVPAALVALRTYGYAFTPPQVSAAITVAKVISGAIRVVIRVRNVPIRAVEFAPSSGQSGVGLRGAGSMRRIAGAFLADLGVNGLDVLMRSPGARTIMRSRVGKRGGVIQWRSQALRTIYGPSVARALRSPRVLALMQSIIRKRLEDSIAIAIRRHIAI